MIRGIYKKLFAEFFLKIFQWKILLSRAEGLQSRIPNGICSLGNGNAIFAVHEFHLIFSCTESYFYAKIYKCI